MGDEPKVAENSVSQSLQRSSPPRVYGAHELMRILDRASPHFVGVFVATRRQMHYLARLRTAAAFHHRCSGARQVAYDASGSARGKLPPSKYALDADLEVNLSGRRQAQLPEERLTSRSASCRS
jgi:hypothetical protein